MSDLISRSALIKKIESMSSDNDVRNNSHQFTYKELVYIICNQPTAYDVEKVVEQLEQQAEQYRQRGFEVEARMEIGSNMADKYYGKQCSYLHAIEIVKGGVE